MENRRIVELTLQPGMSVARAEGVNSHHVFDWRRAYREGRLVESGAGSLVPVVVAGTDERAGQATLVDQQAGTWDVEHPVIHIPLTHEDIAAMHRTTRESVTRALGALKAKHILSVAKNKITVLRKHALEAPV